MVSMTDDKKTFIHVGNNLAVDFINTQYVNQGELVDQLSSLDALYQWATEMGVLLEDDNGTTSMEDVWQLRHSVKTLLAAYIEEQALPKEALNVINRQLKNAPLQQQLLAVAHEFALQPLHATLSIEQLLGKIAYEVASLLTSNHSRQIKRCSNEKCVLMFVDTSRSKKRRWCSMDSCGNRAKAANYYQTQKH
ncbi:MAG: CGNR zinc finger domain-containing protein [Marinomonas sp.]